MPEDGLAGLLQAEFVVTLVLGVTERLCYPQVVSELSVKWYKQIKT
jgi:hypothetical protein